VNNKLKEPQIIIIIIMKKESPWISKHLYISLSPKLPAVAGLKALSPLACQRRQCGTKPNI
jgi:hypothetical protein